MSEAPSSPRVAIGDPPTVSDTSITICWLPSEDAGERNDVVYNIYLLQFEEVDKAYQRVMTEDRNTDADPSIALCHTIQNLIPQSTYSVVVTAANNATNDPESFADVSVVQDRFIAFHFETRATGKRCLTVEETT